MQRTIAVLILGAGLAFLAGEYVPSSSEREEQLAAMTRIVARANILEPETVAAEQPGLRRPVASPAATYLAPPAAAVAATAAPANDAPATLAAVEIPAPPAATPPAMAAASASVQRSLAREIQSELKRVGCYSGRLDGSWGERSRSAMSDFIARVNASLPTTEPDVFLLSLIKGQTRAVCGPSCSSGEVNVDGRCVKRAVVAAASPRDAADRPSLPATKPSPATTVAAAPQNPLPGRMSVGGPVAGAAPPAPPVTQDWSAAEEALPWQPAPKPKARAGALAALDPDEPRRIRSNPQVVPRKVVKVKRTSAAPQPRPRPVKRRYSTSRSVQNLFLHPLGRM